MDALYVFTAEEILEMQKFLRDLLRQPEAQTFTSIAKLIGISRYTLVKFIATPNERFVTQSATISRIKAFMQKHQFSKFK